MEVLDREYRLDKPIPAESKQVAKASKRKPKGQGGVIDKAAEMAPEEAAGKEKNVAKVDESGKIKIRNMGGRSMSNKERMSKYHVLDDSEISSIERHADSIGVPSGVLRFNKGNRTGFDEFDGVVNIRGDIFPDMNSTENRDRLSERAVLAHEYYGHMRAHPSQFRIGDWRDEFRASYRAALDTPNLTDEERRMLMIDAYERAKEAGVTVSYNHEARRVIHGIE